MASQGYIIEREAIIADAEKITIRGGAIVPQLVLDAIRESREALDWEENYVGRPGGYPENRDCWGTFWLHLLGLARVTPLPEVREACEEFAGRLKNACGFA